MRWLIITLVLLLALPTMAQEATPEATDTTMGQTMGLSPLLNYSWCGYLLLEGVIVDADALALLATLFPPAEDEAPLQAQMQWRARPDGNGGILEGCHVLPVERWRVVSLLQQATGMDYAQMDASLSLTVFPDVDAVRGFLEQNAAEWEAPIETPTPDPAL